MSEEVWGSGGVGLLAETGGRWVRFSLHRGVRGCGGCSRFGCSSGGVGPARSKVSLLSLPRCAKFSGWAACSFSPDGRLSSPWIASSRWASRRCAGAISFFEPTSDRLRRARRRQLCRAHVGGAPLPTPRVGPLQPQGCGRTEGLDNGTRISLSAATRFCSSRGRSLQKIGQDLKREEAVDEERQRAAGRALVA